jgi:hypothetical protein
MKPAVPPAHSCQARVTQNPLIMKKIITAGRPRFIAERCDTTTTAASNKRTAPGPRQNVDDSMTFSPLDATTQTEEERLALPLPHVKRYYIFLKYLFSKID